jgi:hypothetical protein
MICINILQFNEKMSNKMIDLLIKPFISIHTLLFEIVNKIYKTVVIKTTKQCFSQK